MLASLGNETLGIIRRSSPQDAPSRTLSDPSGDLANMIRISQYDQRDLERQWRFS